VNATAPDRRVRNAPDKHERGEVHHVLALALDQMDQDRDGQRGQAGEEQWRKKRRHLSRP
jgi:hypothetical protein